MRQGRSATLPKMRCTVNSRRSIDPNTMIRGHRELLSRLGDGAQFSALKWVAEHGCDTEVELSEAEDLVRAYQDSPDRKAMLATLTQLRRRP
jgi:hypothetical protein